MPWVIAVIVVIVCIYLLMKKMSSPLTVAKLQKRTYEVYKRQNPRTSKEELRLMTISDRPGFNSPEKLLQLTLFTDEISKKLHTANNFQLMIYVMITVEFKDMGKPLGIHPDRLLAEIRKIIPASY